MRACGLCVWARSAGGVCWCCSSEAPREPASDELVVSRLQGHASPRLAQKEGLEDRVGHDVVTVGGGAAGEALAAAVEGLAGAGGGAVVQVGPASLAPLALRRLLYDACSSRSPGSRRRL